MSLAHNSDKIDGSYVLKTIPKKPASNHMVLVDKGMFEEALSRPKSRKKSANRSNRQI